VAVDPYIVLGAVPTVEQITPPLGMVIVPVGSEGMGLTPGEAISVEPSGMPACETGAPMAPSGVVALIEGVGAAMPVTWAKAAFAANKEINAAAVNVSFTALSCCRTVADQSNDRRGPVLAASHGNTRTAVPRVGLSAWIHARTDPPERVCFSCVGLNGTFQSFSFGPP
jgi:hypothetical protein